MKLDSQQVLAQVDRLIEEARLEDIPALSAALSARVSVATVRFLVAAEASAARGWADHRPGVAGRGAVYNTGDRIGPILLT